MYELDVVQVLMVGVAVTRAGVRRSHPVGRAAVPAEAVISHGRSRAGRVIHFVHDAAEMVRQWEKGSEPFSLFLGSSAACVTDFHLERAFYLDSKPIIPEGRSRQPSRPNVLEVVWIQYIAEKIPIGRLAH